MNRRFSKKRGEKNIFPWTGITGIVNPDGSIIMDQKQPEPDFLESDLVEMDSADLLSLREHYEAICPLIDKLYSEGKLNIDQRDGVIRHLRALTNVDIIITRSPWGSNEVADPIEDMKSWAAKIGATSSW